ncbi:hypothetical protein EON82_09465 [bacterium]|nr:MAG: hypothetical protein EON82_09465 [bacterium]
MPLDKRASRCLNGLCATVAISAIGVIGWLSYRTQQADRSFVTPPATSQLRDLLRTAVKAAKEGNAEEARRCFEGAIRLNPRHAYARSEYARFLLSRGLHEEAWTQLSAYVPKALSERNPVVGGTFATAWYGDLEARFGDAKRADAICRTLAGQHLSEYGKNATGARLRAIAHCVAGGGLLFGPPSPDRIGHDRRAVELDPKLALAHLSLAHALVEAKRTSEARQPLDTAVRLIKPDELQLKVIAAHLLFDAGEKPQSLAILRQVARRVPIKDTGLVSMIGYDLMRSGQKAEAMAMLERAKPFADPRRTKVYVGFAFLVAQLGQKAEGLAMARKAESLASAEDRGAVREAIGDLMRNGQAQG